MASPLDALFMAAELLEREGSRSCNYARSIDRESTYSSPREWHLQEEHTAPSPSALGTSHPGYSLPAGFRGEMHNSRTRSYSFSSTTSIGGSKRSVKSRETHNQLEKNRRAQLKHCFDSLKETVPCIKDAKISTVAILEQASDYIGQLKKTHRDQLTELRALVQRQLEYKKMLEEKGWQVNVPDLGTYARRALDPSYMQSLEEMECKRLLARAQAAESSSLKGSLNSDDDASIHEAGRIKREAGLRGTSPEEGDESDEVVVDIVDEDTPMEDVDEPPRKRQHSVCVQEDDDDDDIDIVGGVETGGSSVPIAIPGGARSASSTSPSLSMGSAAITEDSPEPGFWGSTSASLPNPTIHRGSHPEARHRTVSVTMDTVGEMDEC